MKKKIYSLIENLDTLVFEVGGTIGDEETLQLYKSLSELKSENLINIKTIMISPYFADGNANPDIELSSRTKVTRKAFGEALSLGVRPDFIVLRNKCEVLKNDIEYIAHDCNLSEKAVFLDPQLSNIYELPVNLEQQGFIDYFIQNKKKVIGRLEMYNEAKNELSEAPTLNVGVFGKTMSYDSYISLKEAIAHAGVENRININIVWLDDLFKNGKIIPLNDLDGIIVGEGADFIKEKLAMITWARESNIPLLAISYGADLLVKEFCDNVLKVKFAMPGVEKPFEPVTKNSLYSGNKLFFTPPQFLIL